MRDFLPIIIMLGVMGGLYYVLRVRERRRSERLQAICTELGLTFFPNGDSALMEQLSHFHLFTQGVKKKMRDMLYGETPDAEIAVFGYQYDSSSSNQSTRVKQTVMYFRAPSLDLPHFALRPENMMHKLGQLVGYQDIDFDDHAEFSKRYLLRGADEEAVRGVFSEQVLRYCENHEDFCLEADGHRLVVYREATRVRPDGIRAFMEEGFRIFQLFRG